MAKATPVGDGSWLAALDSVSLRSNFEFTLLYQFQKGCAWRLLACWHVKVAAGYVCWLLVRAEIGVACLRLGSRLGPLVNVFDAPPEPTQVVLRRPREAGTETLLAGLTATDCFHALWLPVFSRKASICFS